MNLKNIYKNYGDITIFNNLSVNFEKGKFYTIIGPSGCGKSTLINILGLLDTFQTGNYKIGNKDISKLNDKDLAKIRMENIGLIFQDYYLNPRLTAYENILIATLINPKIKKEDRQNVVDNYLKKLGLYERKNHFPKELSGGEAQRVCIARALVNEPDYILADEPTGSLDNENSKIIMDILKSLTKSNKCVIMVTHDMSLIKLSDITYKIENKKLELYK